MPYGAKSKRLALPRKRDSRRGEVGAQAREVMRVVLDTNVVLSALLFRTGRLAWIREAWSDGRIWPIVSRETAVELMRALAYGKFQLSADEQSKAFAMYIQQAEALAEPTTKAKLPPCRDPNDLIFPRLAYAANADALVSDDTDLLATSTMSRVPLITPEKLETLLQHPPDL